MKFRTELLVSPFSFYIDHQKSITLLGSCFSENIGARLKQSYLTTLVNPHGTVFNPYSLAQIIENAQKNETVSSDFICQTNDLYKSFLHHSSLHALSESELQMLINQKNEELIQSLKNSHIVFITLGTAWVYQLKQNEQIVNNCQKQNQSLFVKRLLSSIEIKDSLEKTIELLQLINPKVETVFTLSPVRHVKDGLVENNLSKALLLSQIHAAVKKNANCYYFPSYELVIDDLRDYRFYEKDLIHPNEMAIDYVWGKFESAFFSMETKQINQKIARLNAALKHRILGNSKSEKQKFAYASLQLCAEITKSIGIDLSSEEAHFNSLT